MMRVIRIVFQLAILQKSLLFCSEVATSIQQNNFIHLLDIYSHYNISSRHPLWLENLKKNWLIKKIVISRVQQQSTALNRVYGPFLLDQYLTLFLGDFVKVKLSLIVYHDVIYHLSYSNHGEFIFGSKCWIWRIFSKFLEDFSR